MCPYASSLAVMGSYWFLSVLWVLVFPYASLWVVMGHYRPLCVSMDCNGSLWVLIGPYASLWVPIGPYAF